jgi:hypothetical protein
MNTACKIETGDWVGSRWNDSPEWTPYAQAIADHYPIQVPWFLTTTVTLSPFGASSGSNRPVATLTRPQLYDVLIFGMHAQQSATPNTAGGEAYLNIIHQETGIPWVAPNTLGYAPLGAFAGLQSLIAGGRLPLMNHLKLPEVFFLPAHSMLKFEWQPFRLDLTPPVTVILTMLGVQLINHRAGFRTPEYVRMPNGNDIRVGSRLPWFGAIPYGARVDRTFGAFSLPAFSQAVNYLPPQDCNVEIHGVYADFTDSTFVADPSTLRTKLDVTRETQDWTPMQAPIPDVYGSLFYADPGMPFTKPYLLKKDSKILMTAQANETGGGNTVTFRGVRLCEY